MTAAVTSNVFKTALGKLSPATTALLVSDVQEAFRKHILHFDAIVQAANRAIKSCKVLNVPYFVTEQYPKGLGKTVSELEIDETSVIAKTQFSMYVDAVADKLKSISGLKSILLVGIEAHVCVLQTALDLLEAGYEVHLLADAISSRSRSDRILGLRRAATSGAFLTSTESAIFQLCLDASHPKFKEVQSLFKKLLPDTGLFGLI